jgi:tetratricopeptide (TPR) repeat protein
LITGTQKKYDWLRADEMGHTHLLRAVACLATIASVASLEPTAAFDSSKFPGRGKREAFARSCEYDQRGIALEEKGKPKEAIEQYKKAIAIYPYFAVHYCNFGNALSDLHRYPEAVEQYKKAVKLAPDFAAAYSNMADALTKQKDFVGAEIACKNALRVDPDYVPAMTNMGEVYLATNRPENARTILGAASGLATTAGLKKIIAADLRKANEMLEASSKRQPARGKGEIPR